MPVAAPDVRRREAGPSRPARSTALVVAAASAAVLVAGGAAVLTGRGTTPAQPASVGEQVRLDDGSVRVDNVIGAATPHGAMPGMGTDADPVPDGFRRIMVEVTLTAGDDEPLRYAADDFRLHVTGGKDYTPHRVELAGTSVPTGMTRSGTLTYQVPAEASAGRLVVDDAAAPVDMPLPAESTSHH